MLLDFFFNDTATTEIYTLSLHDALPILLDQARLPHYKSPVRCGRALVAVSWYAEAKRRNERQRTEQPLRLEDRKSTRLNSSHANISYAVFCLKKKELTHTVLRSVLCISF